MLLNEIFLLIEGPWKKYGSHRGIQHRIVTPEDRAKEAKKLTPTEKTKIVKTVKLQKEKKVKIPREKKPRIPRFSSAEPTNDIERLAKDAMFDVWQQIAPDILDAIGEIEDPYEVAEVCTDASRLQTNAGLSPEEEAKILKLPDRTLARLASDFGY